MKFSPALLDDIRSRVPVSSVVGRRVQWDRRKSVPARGDFWACCPFHTEKTPSFHADDRKGRYHCFACKQSGDIFTFLVEKEGLSFPEAVERLAQDAGIPVPKQSRAEEEREARRASLYDVMEAAAAFFEAQLQSSKGSRARDYLSSRGVIPALQQSFRLGYAADDRQALRTHLADKNIILEQMIEAGLVISGDDVPVAYDRFRDRVIFPIRDARGRVIAFGGRALSNDSPAKYLNSPETPLFHKGRVLFNFDQARGAAFEQGTIILVEGYLDVISMVGAGFLNTVAPLGTALTEDQLMLLWRTAPVPLLCFDGDSAGLKAADRALDLALPLLKPGYSLKSAELPPGHDPDDLIRTSQLPVLRSCIARALSPIDLLWRRLVSQRNLKDADVRAKVEADIDLVAKSIRDNVVARHYRNSLKNLFWESIRGTRNDHKGQTLPSFHVNRNKSSYLLNVLISSEWELISWIILLPQLIEDHLDSLSLLRIQDRYARSTLEAFLDYYTRDHELFVLSSTTDLLEFVDGVGIRQFRRYFLGTFLRVFTNRIAAGKDSIIESFESAISEVQASAHIKEEKIHAEVDFDGGIMSFESRIERLRLSHRVPPIRDHYFYELTQELSAARKRAIEVAPELDCTIKTGTGS